MKMNIISIPRSRVRSGRGVRLLLKCVDCRRLISVCCELKGCKRWDNV